MKALPRCVTFTTCFLATAETRERSQHASAPSKGTTLPCTPSTGSLGHVKLNSHPQSPIHCQVRSTMCTPSRQVLAQIQYRRDATNYMGFISQIGTWIGGAIGYRLSECTYAWEPAQQRPLVRRTVDVLLFRYTSLTLVPHHLCEVLYSRVPILSESRGDC